MLTNPAQSPTEVLKLNTQDKMDLTKNAGSFVQMATVYVKAVDSSDVQGLEGVPPGTKLYGIFSSEGAPLAVLGNRDAAFYAARENNMFPVSLH